MKQSIKDYIENSNAKFELADAAKKRVIIAKDVIMRLKTENLVAETGILVGLVSDNATFENSLKNFLNADIESCEVCAKGALFCSLIGRINKFSIKDINSESGNDESNKIHKELKKYFSIEQLDLIEIAFEGDSYLGTQLDDDIIDAAQDFYYEYEDDSNNRLIAICENIIKNKGEFKP